MPSFSERREVAKGMDDSSVSGPDDFTRYSFSHCWEIVEPNVCTVVQSFFFLGFIKPGSNSCNMVLIPKCSQASSVGQYRPIVLGNILFKIMEKNYALRLAPIASTVISDE